MPACCAPSNESDPQSRTPTPSVLGHASPPIETAGHHLIDLPGGRFRMGSVDPGAYASDGEGPVHPVVLEPFRIDRHAVTNDHFAAFVTATGHVTGAEREGWSFVFGGLLPEDFTDTRGVAAAPWWRQVYDAIWHQPEGPQSNLDGRGDHPVVHVSWNDAQAYCRWSGTVLPTEAQWEYAARGGLADAPFPWGHELEPEGRHLMNVFQGTFPNGDTMADGYSGTAPVHAFPPNGYGLHNMTGNVWEWCADWFDSSTYQHGPTTDPEGPGTGTHRVMRGGSYLCHHSYCRRYRVSARSANTPASSTGNLGFRVASPVSPA